MSQQFEPGGELPPRPGLISLAAGPIPALESGVTLEVNGIVWALRVLSGDLYVNGRPVPFLVSAGDQTITVSDHTSPSHFGAAVLIAMNGAPDQEDAEPSEGSSAT